MDVVRIHSACLFRPEPVTRCGDIVPPPIVDPTLWPLVVAGIMLVAIAIVLLLSLRDPRRFDSK